jgi:hypothetical protein
MGQSPGGDLLVDGAKIRVAPEDGEGVGVFFVDDAGTETPVTQRLSRNDPKHLTVRIPTDLAVGSYRLKIVTRFSNNTTLLKENRTLLSEQTLTVKNPE